MSISSAERAYQRFLLRFSYMGTRYRGVQRQQPRSSTAVDRTTVQSALESALDSILRLQLPASLVISSRTDSGVHAHANSGHVDLTPFPGRSVPRTFLRSLNKYLRKADHDIVVREAIPVPHWYHSRAMAERRRYVYRVGFLKNPENNEEFNTRLPLTCWRTSLMVNTAVDIEKVQQACELLQGCHDFKSFQSLTDQKTDPVRHMEEVTFVPDYDAGNLCPYSEDYTWWKFNITARSFLYKQVRRMVSAALYVGRGLIPLEQVWNVCCKISTNGFMSMRHNSLIFLYAHGKLLPGF